MSDVLVLSAGYEPIGKVGWDRAITLLWEDKVEVVESYDNWVVRSANDEWRVPSVVRFLRLAARRRRVVKFSRDHVYARDRARCQYCGARVSRDEYTYDHVTPRAQGGQTCWTNVVVCCYRCNQRKGGRTPQQAGMKLLAAPVKPTKLPEELMVAVTFRKGDPKCWQNYCRDTLYWKDELST